jgi:flagellar motor switch protein FliN
MAQYSDSAVVEATQKGFLEQFANTLQTVAEGTFAMLADPNLKVSPALIETYTDLSSALPMLLTTPHVVGCSKWSSGLTGELAILMTNETTALMGSAMMGDPPPADFKIVGDVELSAIGEVFSQLTSSTGSQLAQQLGQSVDVSSVQVFNDAADTLLTQLSSLQAEPVVVLKLDISGSSSIPSSTLLIIFNQALIPSTPEPVIEKEPPPVEQAASSHSGFATNPKIDSPVTVQPVQFQSFDTGNSPQPVHNKNLDLVMDVKLNLTVELGRSELPIKDVLELTRGSVIELNRIAGEAVDLYVNGKMIAKGEVVIIEDNFGLRITSIISPADRLKGL